MTQFIGISLFGWHLFVKEDIRFTGNSAILGKNAAGKSTLIDLIQAVMTGGSGTLYKFNRSAGEGGGRSERTLRSYCRGQTDEGNVIRKSGITHVALHFGGAGASHPVTLGLCIEYVESEDAVRITGRYVTDGVIVGTGMFTDKQEGGYLPVSWDVLRIRLKKACADAGGDLFEHHSGSSSSKSFIREYIRVLFTGRRAVDSDRFIKAFIMALSFEDMRSVEDFVRSYLLAREDINIGELRGSIQRYQQIQADIAELQRKLEALHPIREEIANFESLLEDEDVADRMRRLAELLDSAKERHRLLDLRRQKTASLEQLSSELGRIEDDITLSNTELESVRAQIATSGVDGQRQQLRTELELHASQKSQVVGRLSARHAPVAAALKLLDVRDRIQSFNLGLGPLLGELDHIREEGGIAAPPAWPRNPGVMERLIVRAGAICEERLPKVVTKRDEATALRIESQGRAADLALRLADSKQGKISLTRNVADFMALLRAEGFNPRALCEIVDVVDETWRNAAEALLGRDREAIIVDPQHAEQAISLLRRERSRYPGCRVANTRKLASSSDTARSGTLASTLRSDDAIAMAFVVFRLGNVRLAETQSDLMTDGRAILKDGTYYDGLVVEVRPAGDLKIGRVAAALMSETLAREFADATQLVKTHQANASFLGDIHDRLIAFGRPFPETDGLERLAIELSDIDARREDANARLERVAMQIDPQLIERQRWLEGRTKELQAEILELGMSIGKIKTELEQLRSQLSGAQEIRGSWWHLQRRWRNFRERVRSTALFGRLRQLFVALRGSKTDRAAIQELEIRIKDLADKHRVSEARVRDRTSEYIYKFGAQRPFEGNSEIVRHYKPWVLETIEILEGNDLVKYRRQADDAANQVTSIFRTSFIQVINGRFRALEREIEDVRVALRSKQLHGEIYSLHALVRPEFKHLYDLARASETNDEVLARLFSADAGDHPYAEAIAHVERLLRDLHASFEPYEDYRNYFTFELRMRNVTTGVEINYDRRRGVASGAERQVPFYVIIGAALASIYHGTKRTEDERGLGLAVFDEAFSKMDGQNQRTMLQFYNEIGLQVLIAAPTEKRAVVYENLDSIVDVHRHGTSATTDVTRIKEKVREAMREANPEHLTDEDLIMRLADPVREQDEMTSSNDGAELDEEVH